MPCRGKMRSAVFVNATAIISGVPFRAQRALSLPPHSKSDESFAGTRPLSAHGGRLRTSNVSAFRSAFARVNRVSAEGPPCHRDGSMARDIRHRDHARVCCREVGHHLSTDVRGRALYVFSSRRVLRAMKLAAGPLLTYGVSFQRRTNSRI